MSLSRVLSKILTSAIVMGTVATGCGNDSLSLQAQVTSQTGYPQVEWTGSALESIDSFSIYRSDDGGPWTLIGQVGSRSRAYVDQLMAVEGVEYRYQVAGLRSDAEIVRSVDGPATSTRSLPETAITASPTTPLSVINETDIALEGIPGASPLTSFVYVFDHHAIQRVTDPVISLRNLSRGDHQILVWALDASGNLDITPARATFTVSVPFAPKLLAVQGGGRACTSTRSAVLEIAAEEAADVMLSENADLAGGAWQPIPPEARITFPLSEGEGRKTIYGRFRSRTGAESLTVADHVYYDVTPPIIHIEQPQPGITTSHVTISVTGTFVDASPIDPILVNKNYALHVGMDGFMRPLMPLAGGPNAIEVLVRDCAGNEARANVEITRDPNAPAGNCGT